MSKFTNFLKVIPTFAAFAVCSHTHADEEALKKAIEAGKGKFITCAACHGNDGKGREMAPGMLMAPSFFDSELIKMSPEVTAVILLKGIKKDDPAAYSGQVMIGLGAGMDDQTLANLITYIRADYGEKKELVTAEQIAKWRTKHKDTEMLTRDQLKEIGEEAKKSKEAKKEE